MKQVFFVVSILILSLLSPFPVYAQSAFTIHTTATPSLVAAGSSVSIQNTITPSVSGTYLVDVEVYDSYGNRYFQKSFDNQSLLAGQANVIGVSWNTPQNFDAGTYNVDVGIFGPNWSGLDYWTNSGSFTISSATPAPVFTITGTLNQTSAVPGDTVTLNANIISSIDFNAFVDLEIHDSNWNTVAEKTFDNQQMSANNSNSYSLSWIIPSNTSSGTYTTSILVYGAGFNYLYGSLGDGDVNSPVLTVGSNSSSSSSSSSSTSNSSSSSSSSSSGGSSGSSGIPGDINGDGKVNIFDLSAFLRYWNSSNPAADLNHDGKVNIFDLSILLSNWGK